MKITDLTINHLVAPLGYDLGTPRASYLIQAVQGKRQVRRRITVRTTQTVYDSGIVETGDFANIELPIQLEPCTRYFWQVWAWTEAGEEATAESWFETGKMGTPWAAKWLRHERSTRLPVFSKEIPVKPDLVSARLYICGLGVYEAYLTEAMTNNCHDLTPGNKIGDEVLAPYCNNYNRWIQYQTYDVTAALQKARFLHVHLGWGWYMSRFGFFGGDDADSYYGKEHRLLAEVRLQYADGTVETVGTDESWVTWPSNITYSTIYDGEYMDDTLMPEAPEAVRLLEEEMLPLSDRYSPPVRIQQLIRPVALLHTPAGEQVFDLGQNMSGVFRLRIRGEKGQKVHIQVGEVLQEGNFYRENLRSAKAEFFYTCGGEQVTIQPKFTYYGFRYVKVEGVEVAENDLEGLVYYSDMEEIGFLTTGHEKVNRLISNAHWGLRGNFLDVPTDCPQRDERMGWTGDAQVFSGTANFFRNTYNFYRKYLHDMDTEQQDLAGKVPIVVPSFGYTDTACVWGDAATIMPWNLYLFTGDTAILQEQYGSMKGWVDHLVAFDGDDRRWGQAFHYGDWLALDHANRKSDQVMGGTAEDYIAYVYLGHSAGLVSKAAALLGREEEAAHYAALKEEIYDYVRHEYFTPGGRCAADTQTAYLIALRYGVAPDREKAIAMLKKTFTRNEGKLQTGFVGSPHLCNVLTEVGMEKLSYDLLLNEDYPGWLYAVNLGATTIWERWNSMEADGSVSSTGMNSFNHYSYGSICEWMFRHVAGLNPLESAPGFRKVEIKPVPDPRLGHINMEYRSISGTYRVSWQVEGKRHVVLDVTVPFGCEAELTLYRSEEAPMVLTAGVYHFEYDTVTSMGAALSMDSKLWELFDDPEAAEILRQFDIGTFSIPTQHWNDTLRQIAGTAEGNVSQAQAAAIDEMLKKL